ncbi:MAG: DUF2179 domain-containing protein [Ekhidna sp.]|uniref:DUF2179 domain-containing protein n=1 Tax=Ekhidna sp. TaxID=2608089 RepID=UPI0032F08248
MNLSEILDIDADLLNYVVIPALIFFARICDVSINTLRIILMLNGRKYVATILGFFEASIWLVAISQIFQNLGNWQTAIAYASGYAMGIFVGMMIEERLAIGNVVVRVITAKPADGLIEFFKEKNRRFTSLAGESGDGPVNVLFTVIKREKLGETLEAIKKYNPQALYTVEGVKKVSDGEVVDDRGFSRRIFRLGGGR